MTEEILNKILKDHKDWLNGVGGQRADLRGADLRGANLLRSFLPNAVLTETKDILFISIEGKLAVVWYNKGVVMINIGCQSMSYPDWKKVGPRVAKEHGINYEESRRLLVPLVNLMKRRNNIHGK